MSVDYNVNIRYNVDASGLKSPSAAAFTAAQTNASGSSRLAAAQRAALADEKKYASFGLKAATGFAHGLTSAFDTVGAALIDTVSTAAVAAGGAFAAALTVAVREGISFNDLKESAVLGLATTQSMIASTPFEQGLKNAEGSVERLRRAAALLPGEFKDALGAFSSILPAGLSHGLEMKRIETMAARSVAAAAALGVPQNVAGHELAAILEGRARSSMPLVTKLGLHASEINAMKPAKRVETIETLFGRTEPALQAYSASFAGLTSTARDDARQLASVMTAPLFGSIKTELGRGLEWFTSNEDRINAVATRFGVTLDYAFHRALDFIGRWYGPVATFGAHLYDAIDHAFSRVSPYLDRMGGMLDRFLSAPDSVSRLASIGGQLLAARAGLGVADLGLDGLKSVAPLLSGLGGGLGEFSIALGAGSIAAAALGVAAYGAVDSLTDSTSRFHESSVAAASTFAANMGKIVASATKEGGTIKTVADAYGSYVLNALSFYSSVLVNGAEDVQAHLGPLAESIAFATAKLRATETETNRPDQGVMSAKWFSDARAMREGEDFSGTKNPKVPNHVTHVTNHITIEVSSNQDPNRIAKLTAEHVRNATKNPTQSPGHPTMRFVQGVPY